MSSGCQGIRLPTCRFWRNLRTFISWSRAARSSRSCEARLGAPRQRRRSAAQRPRLHPGRRLRHPRPRPVPDPVRRCRGAASPDHPPRDRAPAQGRGPLRRRGREARAAAADRPQPTGAPGAARVPARLGPLRQHRHQPDDRADQPPRLLQLRDHDRRPAGPHPAFSSGESSAGPDRLTAAVSNFIATYGLVAVFVLMVFESCGFPFPSEVVMPTGGLLAATGHMPGGLVAVIVAGAVANLVGSLIAYGAAARFGEPLLLGPGRYVGIRRHHLEMADGWFRRWGLPAVFIGRVLPVIRTYISFPAGLARIDLTRFSVLTFAGALPWCAALAIVGYVLGRNYDRISGPLEKAALVIALVVVVAVVVWYVRGRRETIR